MANEIFQLYNLDNSRLKRWLLIELLFAVFIFTVWCIKDVFFKDVLGSSDFIITCIIVSFPFLMMLFTAVLLYVTKSSDRLRSPVHVISITREAESLLEKQKNENKRRYIMPAHHYGSSCAICLERDQLLPLPGCGHCFHEECIAKWFLENQDKNCPTCRRSQTNKETVYSFDYLA